VSSARFTVSPRERKEDFGIRKFGDDLGKLEAEMVESI